MLLNSDAELSIESALLYGPRLPFPPDDPLVLQTFFGLPSLPYPEVFMEYPYRKKRTQEVIPIRNVICGLYVWKFESNRVDKDEPQTVLVLAMWASRSGKQLPLENEETLHEHKKDMLLKFWEARGGRDEALRRQNGTVTRIDRSSFTVFFDFGQFGKGGSILLSGWAMRRQHGTIGVVYLYH
ncbi:hypothetical protein N657DRAFT_649703 [Parathielavia appendiculata]|uniref:Uncharacterized protein n=1 Tax=Parathielavia appendiculata TaxID=2587402 RepID=A0AAN6TTL0_9PEZI|nr:hypothetical protein N657DRAFT_649703 [Parathielavia appendiculata]